MLTREHPAILCTRIRSSNIRIIVRRNASFARRRRRILRIERFVNNFLWFEIEKCYSNLWEKNRNIFASKGQSSAKGTSPQIGGSQIYLRFFYLRFFEKSQIYLRFFLKKTSFMTVKKTMVDTLRSVPVV